MTTSEKALQRARVLQKQGISPFIARCTAAREYGLHVSDVNHQYAVERRQYKKTVQVETGKPSQMEFRFK